MSDQTCDCCEPTAEQPIDSATTTDSATTDDRWLTDGVMDAPLPSDMKRSMSQFFGEDIAHLDSLAIAIREAAGGNVSDRSGSGGGSDGDGTRGSPLAIDQLCHVEGETPHRATTLNETYYFRCFYDGVALAHLADEPVEIQTESPAGEIIEMRVSPTGDIAVTPSDAAMSFGIGSIEPFDDNDANAGPVDEIAEMIMCPYVKAFSTRSAYEDWAESVAGATVGMPIVDGLPFAAALTKQ